MIEGQVVSKGSASILFRSLQFVLKISFLLYMVFIIIPSVIGLQFVLQNTSSGLIGFHRL